MAKLKQNIKKIIEPHDFVPAHPNGEGRKHWSNIGKNDWCTVCGVYEHDHPEDLLPNIKKIAPWNDPTIRWVCEDHPTKEQSHKRFFFWECGGAGMPEPTENV